MFNSDTFLSSLRGMHEDLFLVFEKYCTKGAREIALTLTMELMGNLLDDCKLVPEEKCVQTAIELFKSCTSGISVPCMLNCPISTGSSSPIQMFSQ